MQSLGSALAWLTFYPAIMLISIYGGLWAGLLGIFLVSIITNKLWFLIVSEPFINDQSDVIGLVVFVLTGVLISGVSEAMRQANRRAIEAEKQTRVASLLKSEEKYKSTLDHLMEGCQILGFNWRYLYINAAADKHNRCSGNDLIGNVYMDMWPGIEDTAVFRIIQMCMKDRTSHIMENEFVYPDGSHAWFSLSIQPVPEGVLIFSIDITERKKSEIALQESEAKYRLISENSDDWIYWVKPDGKIHYVSPACERVTGYSPEDFENNPALIHDLVYEEDRDKVTQHKQDLTFENTPHNLEFRIVTRNGDIRWINHSCNPIFGRNGEYLGRLGTNRNINERKLKEEQLFESELRFNRLYENGPFGMVMADRNFRFKKTNPAFCAILGFDEGELQELTFQDISHPDDLLKDLINVRKLQNREISVYQTEKRYIRKDGQIIWGSLTVTATYDIDGYFLYFLGIIEDISRRKSAEEIIVKLNERISTATRASQVGIWDWDIKNNLLVWDDQMIKLYGLKKEDFTGAYDAWINGLHPDDREFSEAEIRDVIHDNKAYDTEFRIVWPDGTVRNCKARGEVFRDENGDPVRMVGINYDITEQKKAEEKVREKDLEFRKLSANVSDLIYQFTRRPDGTYCLPIASEGIRNIFGCTPEEVKDDFAPIARVIYPDDVERVMHDIEYSAKHLTYFTCEFRVQIPGRDVQWIYSKSTPEKLPDGSITWFGFNADITDRKLADELLKKSETRFQLMFNHATYGIVICQLIRDESGEATDYIHLQVNESITRHIGIKPVDVLNKKGSEMISRQETRFLVRKFKTVVETGIPNEYQQYLPTFNKTIDLQIIHVEDDFFAVIFFDITEKKQAEERIKKLNEELEERVIQRTSQLEEANKELEAFSYSVSHDLRAPLRHINGFAEILTNEYSGQLSDDAQKYLDTITESAKRMGTLIDDLLSFSRTGRAEMKKTKFKMNQAVEEAIAHLNPSVVDREIDWDISQLPEIQGDYNLLRLVWINLIDNAIKYTQNRKKTRIKIGSEVDEENAIFFIRDNGVGFDMKYAEKLFGVFQRLHTSSEFEGTGIGLANIKRIISRHGGRTWAEAEPDKGATFYFSLPLEMVDNQ